MRIGFFSDSYTPYISGVVHSIETFSRELRNLGHQVVIFAPKYPSVSRETGVFRFPSIPSLTPTGFYIPIPLAAGFSQFLAENPLDIVHVHSPFVLGRLGAKIARNHRCPLVFTYHTLYDQYTHYVPFARQISQDLTRRLCVNFCNRCDLVITPTGVIGEHIKSMGVKSAVQWLPTGIDFGEFNQTDKGWLRNTYDIGQDESLLLFVGRITKEKNISFLVKTLQIMRNELGQQAKLVVVGQGPETESLKRYVGELDLSEYVVFTGRLSREEVVRAYGGADVFVFGSVTETQGLVIGEAKAAGLPVVAVDAFGVSEMVVDGEDGYLVPEDENVFALTTTKILKNSELRQKMSRKALINAKDLSAQSCAKKLVQYYSSLQ